MRIARWLRRLIASLALLFFTAWSASFAAEPRPWLCRDKPSFSSDRPMVYQAGGQRSPRWRIFLMQFEPEARHDGYQIVASTDASTTWSGQLPSGRYFAVAMRLAGNGHWICHAHASRLTPAGASIANLCFNSDGSASCGATLTVNQAPTSPAEHPSTSATPAP